MLQCFYLRIGVNLVGYVLVWPGGGGGGGVTAGCL